MTSMAGTHRHGQHTVTVAVDGKIAVKSGDWLGKYSSALYQGNAQKIDVFGRVKNAKVEKIIGGRINAGETIYHVPTYTAFTTAKAPPKAVTPAPAKPPAPAPAKPPPPPAAIPEPKNGQELKTLLAGGKLAVVLNGTSVAWAMKFTECMCIVTKCSAAELEQAKGTTSKIVDFHDMIANFFDAFKAHREGKSTEAAAYTVIAVGVGWNFLPAKSGLQMVFKRWVKSSNLTRGLETTFDVLEKIGAMGDVAKMVACLGLPAEQGKRNERWAKFDEGSKGLLGKLKDNPGQAARVAAPLAAFLSRFLPKHLVEKLAMKAAGRKVPIIGTLIVGIFDVAEVIRDPKEVSSWVALGSTAAGAVPGAGTAVSIVLDISALAIAVAEALREFKGSENTKVLWSDFTSLLPKKS